MTSEHPHNTHSLTGQNQIFLIRFFKLGGVALPTFIHKDKQALKFSFQISRENFLYQFFRNLIRFKPCAWKLLHPSKGDKDFIQWKLQLTSLREYLLIKLIFFVLSLCSLSVRWRGDIILNLFLIAGTLTQERSCSLAKKPAGWNILDRG